MIILSLNWLVLIDIKEFKLILFLKFRQTIIKSLEPQIGKEKVFLGSKQFFKFSLIHRFCVSVFVIFFFEVFLNNYLSTSLLVFVTLWLLRLSIVFSFYLFLRLSLYLSFSLFIFIFLPLHFFSICQPIFVVLNPSLSSWIFFLFCACYLFLFPYIDLTFAVQKFYFYFFSSFCLFLILVLWSPLNLDDREWFFIFFYFLFSFLLLNHNFVKSKNDVSTDLFVEWKPWKNERNEIKESVSL